MSLLRQHFPTLMAVADEMRDGNPEARFPKWYQRAKREIEAYQAEQRSSKKRAEGDRVLQGYAAAARLLQIMVAPEAPKNPS